MKSNTNAQDRQAMAQKLWAAYRKSAGGISKFTGEKLPEYLDDMDEEIEEHWLAVADAALGGCRPRVKHRKHALSYSDVQEELLKEDCPGLHAREKREQSAQQHEKQNDTKKEKAT